VCRIELAASNEQAFAFAEIDPAAIDTIEPDMAMTIGEKEEKPLDLHAFAIFQKLLQTARTEVCKSLHQLVGLMKFLTLGQFIKQLQDGAFRRGERQGPVPMTPRLDPLPRVQRIGAGSFTGIEIPAQTGKASRDRIVAKK